MEPEANETQQSSPVAAVVVVLLIAAFFTIVVMFWFNGFLKRQEERKYLDGVTDGSDTHFSDASVTSTWRRYYLVCNETGIITGEMEQIAEGSWKVNVLGERIDREYIDANAAGIALFQANTTRSLCNALRP